jgi:hypothetical protein
MSGIYASLIALGSSFFYLAAQSQDSLRNNPLSIAEVCRLALENSIQLKIAGTELNNQLNMVLGLPDTARLQPDTTLLQQSPAQKTLNDLPDDASRENHELKITARGKEVAETNIKLLKGERLPEIGLFSVSALQRPFLNAIPSFTVKYSSLCYANAKKYKYGLS